MNLNYAAEQHGSLGSEEVYWFEDQQYTRQFPGEIALEDDFINIDMYEDPRLSLAIEGREISLLAETTDIGRILEDQDLLHVF